MRYTSALFAASLFLIGGCCNSCKNEMTRYHEDGKKKPSVAIASMIDTTSFEIPWSLSEELHALPLLGWPPRSAPRAHRPAQR